MSTFNFKEVKVQENMQYLQPGQYMLSLMDCKYVKPTDKKPDGSPKTPYLEVKFGGKAGQVTANMYITPKAFERLQYVYTQWFEKECDKEFDTIDAIGAFFEKAFNHEKTKQIVKRISVGGRTSAQGKVFAELGFKNFVIPESVPNFEERAYEVNSPEWMFHVKPAPVTPASGTDSVMLGFSSPVGESKKNSDGYDDDLPF